MACTRKTTFLDRPNRPGRIRLAVHAAPVRHAYQVTVGKSEWKRPLEHLDQFMRILAECIFYKNDRMWSKFIWLTLKNQLILLNTATNTAAA